MINVLCKGPTTSIFDPLCALTMLQQNNYEGFPKYTCFKGFLVDSYTCFFLSSNEDDDNGFQKGAPKARSKHFSFYC